VLAGNLVLKGQKEISPGLSPAIPRENRPNVMPTLKVVPENEWIHALCSPDQIANYLRAFARGTHRAFRNDKPGMKMTTGSRKSCPERTKEISPGLSLAIPRENRPNVTRTLKVVPELNLLTSWRTKKIRLHLSET
jgi:hypothetical protein